MIENLEFNIQKPIVFFDIEATGLNVIKDRIIQLAMIKYVPGQLLPDEMVMLINPGPVLISEDAFKVHGISAQMVANKPTFDQIAQKIWDFIGDSDLAGYNSDRFDIPMLMEEFARTGREFTLDNRNIIDVQKIFYKMEPRTLSAAYRFYCDKKLVGAHDALEDVKATVEVLKGQIIRYKDAEYEDHDGNIINNPVVNDMKSLASFTNDSRSVDVTQRLKYNSSGEIVFNFGKYNGQKVVDVLSRDKQYYNWILEKDFSAQVKQIIRKIVKDNEASSNNS